MGVLLIKLQLCNVRGHRWRQRPTRARCLSDPPKVLVRVASSLWSGARREGGHVFLVRHSAMSYPHDEQYGAETWVLSEAMEKKIARVHMVFFAAGDGETYKEETV